MKELRVLIVTSEWPAPGHETDVPFLVEQVDHLRRAGVETDVFSFRGRAQAHRYAAAWCRLRTTWRWRDFDLVHAHFGQSGLVALPCPVPLVVTFHGSDLQGVSSAGGQPTVKGRWLVRISCMVARRAARVIIVSRHLAEYLPAGVQADVIPCGIDTQRFSRLEKKETRALLGLPKETRLVLFGADPQRTVKRFHLAEETVRCLREFHRIELVPLTGIPYEKVPLYMSACDVLLMTSLYEGSPMVVKEALAAGLPVVSVAVGDVPERLQGVEGCFVCESDDPRALAGCVDRALAGAERSRVGPEVKEFDHAVVSRKILRLYQEVVENQRRGGR